MQIKDLLVLRRVEEARAESKKILTMPYPELQQAKTEIKKRLQRLGEMPLPLKLEKVKNPEKSTLLLRFMWNKISTYREPTKNQMGRPVSFLKKYAATLGAITRWSLKEIAHETEVSYSRVRHWSLEDDFQQMVEGQIQEFVRFFIARIHERVEWGEEHEGAFSIDTPLKEASKPHGLSYNEFSDSELYGIPLLGALITAIRKDLKQTPEEKILFLFDEYRLVLSAMKFFDEELQQIEPGRRDLKKKSSDLKKAIIEFEAINWAIGKELVLNGLKSLRDSLQKCPVDERERKRQEFILRITEEWIMRGTIGSRLVLDEEEVPIEEEIEREGKTVPPIQEEGK